MKPKVLITAIVILVFYTCVSGIIFHYFEYSNESVNKELFTNITQAFLDDHPDVHQEDLLNFTKAVIQAYEEGVFTSKNQTVSTNWDIASSIFFSTTVVTTIGYGHLSPKTVGGQIYCVFLAITGIPICLTMLSGIAEKLHFCENQLDEWMTKRCHTRKKLMGLIRGWTLSLLGIGVFIIAPAFTFSYLEGWDIGPALYYVVITLSTVGFGDFVASVNHPLGWTRALYQMLLSAYIFIGLAWLATVISALQRRYSTTAIEKVRDFTHHTRKVTGKIRRRVGGKVQAPITEEPSKGKISEADNEKSTEIEHDQEKVKEKSPSRRPRLSRQFTQIDIITD